MENIKKKTIEFFLKEIAVKLKICADSYLEKCGMTISQARLIELIDKNGGRATQKEIEDCLQVSHPTVKGIITRLEQKDLLHCYKDENDKRNKIVCLTEKAKGIVSEMYSARKDLESHIINGLSEKEVSELMRLLGHIYINLS